MSKIPLRIVKKILLDLPKSSEVKWLNNPNKVFFNIDNIIVAVPNSDIDEEHLRDILENQLEMSWWMIDYIYGQHQIQ